MPQPPGNESAQAPRHAVARFKKLDSRHDAVVLKTMGPMHAVN